MSHLGMGSGSQAGPLGSGATSAANQQAQRPLYRDQSGGKPAAKPLMNMMSDRRIVRGNTYAAPVVPPSMAQEIERKAKEDDDRQRRRRTMQQSGGIENRRTGMTMGGRPYTPEPVPGRSHAELQTETFLEVISDRPPEFEMGVQTDALQDRPPTPLFVPKPSGVDKDTQILEGELFDFDLEVTPVLEVLVGKTLESALSEVLQEDELSSIRGRREEFEAIRNSELAEVQRLEAEVRRKQEERARRLAQERARLQQERDVQRKVAAAAFARSFVSVMRKNLLNNLKGRGYFYDPLHRAVETQLLPGIYAELAARSDAREVVAATLADDLLSEALSRGGSRFTEWLKAEEERKKKEEEEAKAKAEAIAAEKARKKAEAEAAAAAEAAAGEGGEAAE